MEKEIWKKVNLKIDFELSNNYLIEVSNTGKLRSTNQFNKTQIIKGGTIDGYSIYKATLFKKRDPSKQKRFDNLEKQILKIEINLKQLIESQAKKSSIKEIEEKLRNTKTKLIIERERDNKQRMFRYNKLFHRLVAEYFLPKPKKNEIFIGHLDFNKKNNNVENLKWMTQEENALHNRNNPKNINRIQNNNITKPNSKLSANEVLIIKKQIAQGKKIRELSNKYKVSEMQISRIKNGVNWKEIQVNK